MITKGIEMNITDIVNEIAIKLTKLHSIIDEGIKMGNDEQPTAEMLAFSPEEWETIAITIAHYNLFCDEYRTMKTNEEKRKFFESRASFLGYVRDMIAHWYDMIPKKDGGNVA